MKELDWDLMLSLFGGIVGGLALAALYVAWLAVLPTIGLLWLMGWL